MEGGIRMAVDYREVNQHLNVSANQLPYQDMLFQQLGGPQYYTTVHNLWGYHQLRLDKESSKVIAIITPWGVYRFLTCPFGISTVPIEYQARMVHKVLEGFILMEQWCTLMIQWFMGKSRKFLTNVGYGFG